MRTNHFIFALVTVLVIGGLSGGLVGGLTSGGGGGDDASLTGGQESIVPTPGNTGPGGGLDLQGIRERIQSGDLSPEEAGQLREQIQEQLQGQPRPGAQPGGVQATRFGTIEGIAGNVVSLSTSQGTLEVTINDDATIQRFASGELQDLSAGQQVTVVGQRTDGGVVARSIIVGTGGVGPLPTRPGFAGGQGGQQPGGFGGGQGGFGGGGAALSGTVESIGDGQITVNTEQGPLTATVNESTVIQVLAAASLADLSEGQRITVVGTPGEDGAVSADSIVIPLDVPRFPTGGFGGAGFGGS